MTSDSRPIGPLDEAMLRAVRTLAAAAQDLDSLPSEESLLAYIVGRPTGAQRAEVWAALERNPLLRAEVEALIEAECRHPTEAEQDAFRSTEPPPLERFPELLEIRQSLAGRGARRAAGGAAGTRQWLPALLGGWAAVATAGLVVVLSSPRMSVPDKPAEAPTGPPGLRSVRVIPLIGSTRGPARETTIPIETETFEVGIAADPPDVSPDTLIQVTLVGPSGPVYADSATARALGGGLFVLRGEPLVVPGRYVLRMAWEGGAESLEYVFHIVARP